MVLRDSWLPPFHLPAALCSTGRYPASIRGPGLSGAGFPTVCLHSYGGSDSCREPFPASCPGRSPVFTHTSPARPTATNHTGDDARATMARHVRDAPGTVREADFANRSQARPYPTPNRVYLRCGRSGSYHAALHPASRRRSCASVISFFHGFNCAGSPTRRGCAARRRTSGGICPPGQWDAHEWGIRFPHDPAIDTADRFRRSLSVRNAG